MKTYEEAGVDPSKLDDVISQLLSRDTRSASRDFVEALLKHAREKGSSWVTRQQLAALVGRDTSQAGSNAWAKDESVRAYLDARRQGLSQAFDLGLVLDWEYKAGKPIYWRTGIRDSDAAESFTLRGSVLRYREHKPPIYMSWWGRLLIPGAGSATSTYRKWMFQAPLLIAILIYVAVSLFVAVVMLNGLAASIDGVLALITLAGAMLLIHQWMKRRYGKLLEDRILLLDSTNVGGGLEGATLEFDHKNSKKAVQLRRYVSECPICSGEIYLTDGAKSFPGRLVGRCLDSPQEHVYSFDRVSLEGAPLVARLASAPAAGIGTLS